MDIKNKKKSKSKYKNVISFRVSEIEYKNIQKLLQKLKLNKSDAMRKLVNDTVNNFSKPLNS